MKYKIIGVFVLLSVLFISAPMSAKAYTLNDLMAQITSLQKQVTGLQSAIALKAISPAVVSTIKPIVLPKTITPTISPVITPTTTTTTTTLSALTSITPIPVKPTPLPIKICLPSTAPWIQVTSPNGGENYNAGQQITVTWKGCNISTNTVMSVGLGYNYSGAFNTNYMPQNILVANSGSAVFNLPPTSSFVTNGFQYGMHYRIDVGATGVASDNSDNFFQINASTVPSLPAGCTSSVGYSSTTGISCGCNGTVYSTYNGQLCPTVTPTVSNVPLLFTPLGSDEGVYTSNHGDNNGIFNFIFNIKNTSAQDVYIDRSCGTSVGGLSVRLQNSAGSYVFPSHLACVISWLGSGTSSGKIWLRPGDEFLGTVVYMVDPGITTSDQYRAIIDAVNYQTPLISSTTINASLNPQTNPLAQSWWQLITNYISIN